MDENARPSQTAVASALMRAAHLLLDEPPHVFSDELALPLTGWGDAAQIRAGFAALEADIAKSTPADEARDFLRGVRAVTVVRARYAEDQLAGARGRGVEQYVILGAGLDSYAYCRRPRSDSLQVFEVDHPSTQEWKRARLAAAGQAVPAGVSHVSVNFERQSLVERLEESGFRADLPAFFSWLGVVNYLTDDSIFGTLREIAALPRESEVVFDYIVPDSELDLAGQQAVSRLKADMASRGEPGVSFYVPADLAARLSALGFSEVGDIGPEELNRRYFADRTDGLRLPVPCSARLMRARV